MAAFLVPILLGTIIPFRGVLLAPPWLAVVFGDRCLRGVSKSAFELVTSTG